MIEATLRSGSFGILNVAREARLGENEKLLIVVDQFEELFRFRAAREGSNVDEASAFVKLLLEAAQQRELSIYIVLTMRSDFLGDCAQFQGLPEAINEGQYLIPRMTRDERRFAVTGPVGVTRGKISEALINRLLNDVGDNPDQLPILQHALMRTWDHWQSHRRDGEPIGLEHYEAIGTMADALSRHADEAYNELPDERSRKIAEALFKALSERGTDNREIRRPTTLGTICKITGASTAEVIRVIDIFRGGGRSFLMPPIETELNADSVIDISHESLIRNWQRLKQWVNEEAQSVRVYRRVADTAMLHREGGEGLMQEPALSFALDWREKSQPNAAWGERYHPEFEYAMTFLDLSRTAHDQRIAAEAKRREEEIERDKRELEQAKLFVAQQARAARRMRVLVVALCAILLLSLATAAFAWNQRASAIQSRESAELARKNAELSAAAAKKAEGFAHEQANAANESKEEAVKAQKVAADEKERAEAAAKLATEQKAAAEENLLAAQRATAEAKAATTRAQESARQVASALERGELIRTGLESYRREDYAKARDSFEKLEEKLRGLQPGANGTQNFTPEQAKQVTRDYGWTMSRLGATYHQLREFDKAIKDYENSRVILEPLLADEPAPILFETYHGLAHAYHDNATELTAGRQSTADAVAAEQLSKAEEYYTKAAAYQQKIKSDNPLLTVVSLKNLAQLYLDIGRFDDAEQNLKAVVDVYKTVEYYPGAGLEDALKELAEFYRNRSRSEDAARTYNELIDLYENNANFYHLEPQRIRELADDYSELGQIYIAMKDEARGDAAFELVKAIQGLQLKRKRLGPLQPNDPAGSFDDDLDQMGDIYIKLGRVPQARRSYESALEIREGVVAENPSRAISYLKLANLYRDEYHDYEKAETYYKKLIEIRKNVKGELFGPSDPLSQYVEGLRRLALLYIDDLNKPAEAEGLLNQALTVLTPVHARLAWDEEVQIYSALVALYQKQQKSPEEIQTVRMRKLATMTKRRDVFSALYRTEDYAMFMAAYVKSAGEVADYYVSKNDKTAAEATYAQVFDNIHVSTAYLHSEDLDNYLTNIEKYQALLREHKNEAKAEQWDEMVKEGRALQKELESRQKANP
jgi:tetratricopeptide (TPR) repeat protein